MKLDSTNYYREDGTIDITEQGWIDLRNFCKAIICKYIGLKFDWSDILSRAIINCVDKLPDYDKTKNVPLGGFLYWTVRGTIAIEAAEYKKEIPVGSKLEVLKYGR